MSNRILDSQIQSRNDTAANWSSVNPVLLKGEIGIEIDTRKMKVGDGTTEWNSLKYLKDDIVIASTNPSTTDKDFDLGEFWLNQTDKTLYVLVAKTESAGEWKRIPNAEELVVVSEALVAQKLKTARSISIIGDGSGATTFDGSADASITLVLKNTGASAGTYTKVTVNEKGLITKPNFLRRRISRHSRLRRSPMQERPRRGTWELLKVTLWRSAQTVKSPTAFCRLWLLPNPMRSLTSRKCLLSRHRSVISQSVRMRENPIF